MRRGARCLTLVSSPQGRPSSLRRSLPNTPMVPPSCAFAATLILTQCSSPQGSGEPRYNQFSGCAEEAQSLEACESIAASRSGGIAQDVTQLLEFSGQFLLFCLPGAPDEHVESSISGRLANEQVMLSMKARASFDQVGLVLPPSNAHAE